mgnify:CR=1 FL=1
MNIRKPTDYSAMYGILDQLMGAEFPQMELYFEIGRAVCARPEKGAAVMAAEYLQENYSEARGFSPRNLRRMRELYRAYADNPELRAPTLKLGWTQNVAILEGCEGSQERAWYLRAALEHRWTKAELLERIQAGVWLQSTLDEQLDSCYTEENTVSVECLEHEEDPFCVSRQYLSESDGRVCDEGLGEKGRPGGRVSDCLGGHQPGGDRQPGLPSGPAEAGGARHLRNRDYEEYDLLIGMDRANLRNRYRICGGDFNDKMHLLMEYAGRRKGPPREPREAGRAGRGEARERSEFSPQAETEKSGLCFDEVADPWYTDDFDATWRDVLEGCQGLLDDLLEKGGKTS